jgi:isopropylmalate/homocitrate/citramalate synthase
MWPDQIDVREVGPREGFQNASNVVSTDEKVAIIERLIDAGCTDLNVASFVHPEVTPQMADAEDVLRQLDGHSDITFSGLVPNEVALERAIAVAGDGGALDEVVFLWSNTNSVLRVNGVNRTVDEQFERIREWIGRAHDAGLDTMVGLSASWGCSIEGSVPQADVVERVRRAANAGAGEVFLSDSTGQASPWQVVELISALHDDCPEFPITPHFHDVRGAGLANLLAALSVPHENMTFDAAFGGTGGDPPEEMDDCTGMVATEDLICMLEGMDVDTSIDLDRYLEAVAYAAERFNDSFKSEVPTVGPSIAYREMHRARPGREGQGHR